MFETGNMPKVEDNDENRALCRKYCTICQNYRKHCLQDNQPTELFCARGHSSATGMRMIGCFCTGCEVYTKYHLRGGFFCVHR